jgi:hypothetical protein
MCLVANISTRRTKRSLSLSVMPFPLAVRNASGTHKFCWSDIPDVISCAGKKGVLGWAEGNQRDAYESYKACRYTEMVHHAGHSI